MSNLRIKQITLPSGNTYVVYDEYTREMITSKEYTTGVAYSVGDLLVYDDELYRITAAISASDNTGWSVVSKTVTTIDSELANIRSQVTQVMKYCGVTTTELTDGSTTATITINGQSVTFTADDAGSVVISGTGQNQKEYVWSGTTWNEFGSTGALKALAFKDSASGSYDKTTSITLTVPTVTSNTSKLVTTTASKATADTAVTVANSQLGAETSTRTADTPMWGASVTNETLSFTFKPLSTTSITPYTFTDVTVATGAVNNSATGADVVTSVSTSGSASATPNYTSTTITVS